eukprot:gnl/TRDRNA2_/TRDRNA2_163659_c0_seq2.p1 gnl/TRDRNA2_/TRDRNA2_163659_c0~~gnl/TRDRNA2_/TRDRNA2_163659_c0_seq2.p1  ORF type:complete len:167 (+),score=18.72 gnl/TRDRNA2_/TRDRNA2_163659_c0_seq2:38-502(+)
MIGEQGAERVAASLEHNDVITTLDLSNNRIGQRGSERVADALEHNISLTRIHVSLNHFSPAALKRVAAAELRNKTGFMVLTASCQSQSAAQVVVACFNMAGSQVALAEVEPQHTVAVLKESVSSQLAHLGHLRLVRPDGVALNDLQALVSDCFS